MAFDSILADRIRRQLGQRPGLIEKKMFGGLAFLLNGNMCCGVHGTAMIVRFDPQQSEMALREPFTRPFDLTGKPMKGWLLVEAQGLTDEATLAEWVKTGVDYAAALPPK